MRLTGCSRSSLYRIPLKMMMRWTPTLPKHSSRSPGAAAARNTCVIGACKADQLVPQWIRCSRRIKCFVYMYNSPHSIIRCLYGSDAECLRTNLTRYRRTNILWRTMSPERSLLEQRPAAPRACRASRCTMRPRRRKRRRQRARSPVEMNVRALMLSPYPYNHYVQGLLQRH